MTERFLSIKDSKSTMPVAEIVGQGIKPDTSFVWNCAFSAGRYSVKLEMACHRDVKGNGFEVSLGSETRRYTMPQTGGFDDFRLFDLGQFDIKDGEAAIELRVNSCGGQFGRLKGLHFVPAENALRVDVESVELPGLDYDAVKPGIELWAKSFVVKPGNGIAVEIQTSASYQTIGGVGGTFNEQGGVCIDRLPEKERFEVINHLFGNEHSAFSFCCVPVGASDFALSPYSWNDTPDDFEMNQFSGERDERYMLPYIREAQKVNPALRFHARPWSPPAWMKTTGNMNSGSLKKDPQYYEAYALYLCRFVEELGAMGVSIERLIVQNEPDVSGGYAGCIYTPEEYADFVVNYLRPLAARRHLKSEIWAGSFQGIWKPTAQRVMACEGMLAVVDGLAFQYNLIDNVVDFRLRYPGVRIMHTESPCHGGENTWTEAYSLFQDIMNYFNAGAEVYTYWNMILDRPARSYAGWRQNSLVNVDRLTGEIRYNPDFYIMRLISRGIKPGARRVEAFCFGQRVCAVRNPDASIVLFVDNPAPVEINADISVDRAVYRVELPPRSVSSISFR